MEEKIIKILELVQARTMLPKLLIPLADDLLQEEMKDLEVKNEAN